MINSREFQEGGLTVCYKEGELWDTGYKEGTTWKFGSNEVSRPNIRQKGKSGEREQAWGYNVLSELARESERDSTGWGGIGNNKEVLCDNLRPRRPS